MKNSFKKIAFVALLGVMVGYNVYSSKKTSTLSDLAMTNIEALARGELPEVGITCGSSGGYCWLTAMKLEGPLLPWYVTYCPRFSGSMSDYCTPGLPA